MGNSAQVKGKDPKTRRVRREDEERQGDGRRTARFVFTANPTSNGSMYSREGGTQARHKNLGLTTQRPNCTNANTDFNSIRSRSCPSSELESGESRETDLNSTY